MLTKYQLIAMQLVNGAAAGGVREIRQLVSMLPDALQGEADPNRPFDPREYSIEELEAMIRKFDLEESNSDRAKDRKPTGEDHQE